MRGLAVLLLAPACGPGALVPDVPDGKPPALLSQLGLVGLHEGELTYAEGVQPYRLNTPLFSDYAVKDRAIYVPEGADSGWGDGRWTFDLPVGSAILKSFSVAADLREPDGERTLVETRVLIRTSADGWTAWPYVWDPDLGDATLEVSGEVRPFSIVDRQGEALAFSYLVPQRNQCQECHEIEDEAGEKGIVPIGPTPRNVHPDDLAALVDRGWLQGAPDLSTVPPAVDWKALEAGDLDALSYEAIDAAARDYLDVNCAHCHNPRAVNGVTSQLFLNWDNEDRFRLGICKKPGSAAKGTGGYTHDIVPGDPETSILHYRLRTDDPGSMMPDIGRAVVHHEGIALLERWIAGMEPEDCGE